jgi:hypothetical protein
LLGPAGPGSCTTAGRKDRRRTVVARDFALWPCKAARALALWRGAQYNCAGHIWI